MLGRVSGETTGHVPKGEIFFIRPKRIFTHAAVSQESRPILNLNEELDLGDIFINGVLVTNVEADVSKNPDMVGVLWESLESGKSAVRHQMKTRKVEIEGSPDWLLEIVSSSSVKKDKQDLRSVSKAGVDDIGSSTPRLKIEFQILNWRKSGYVAALRRTAGYVRVQPALSS